MAQPDPDDASAKTAGAAPGEAPGGPASAAGTADVPAPEAVAKDAPAPSEERPAGASASGESGAGADEKPAAAKPEQKGDLASAEAAAIAAETLAALEAERKGAAKPPGEEVDDETTRVPASEVTAAVAKAVSAKSRTSSDERRAAKGAAPVPAKVERTDELPPLEKGQCPLCGTKNREDDVLCTGCGTTIATGEPPPVERFRPRRFDARIAMVLGIVAVALLLGFAVVSIIRTGADERLIASGKKLATAGDWRAAEHDFEEATQSNPESGRAWAALAEARLRNGGPTAKLAEAAEKAVRLAPPNADGFGAARFALGKIRLDEGRVDEASKLLEPGVKERPDLPSARHILGHCRFLRHESGEALAAYEGALASDASSPEAPLSRLRMGILYVDRGKLVEAESTLKKALAEGAPAADTHVAIGDLRAKKNDIDGALAAYEEAVKIDDSRAATRFKMARLRLKSGEKQRALEDILRAIAIDPGDAEYHKFEGRRREEAGEQDRALLAYGEAAKLDPKDAEVHVLMARIHAARGDASKAKDELVLALRIEPAFFLALVEQGDQAGARKDWHAAVDAYKRAIASDGAKADVHVKLARAYGELNLSAEELNAYREAVTVDPACVPAHERLLEIYSRTARLDDARRTLVTLVKLRPKEPEYKIRLARTLIDGKEYDQAERFLEEVLKDSPGHVEAKRLLDKLQYQKFQEQPK